MAPRAGSADAARLSAWRERLRRIDGRLVHSLERPLAGEALELERTIGDITPSQAPFVGFAGLQRRCRQEYARLGALSSHDLWTVLPQLRQPVEEQISTTDNIIHPVDSSLLKMILPKIFTVVVKKEACRSTLRLVCLQLYLRQYQQENGQLPEELPALYAYFDCEPLVDPLTGNRYPYPGVLAGDRVNLAFAAADRVAAGP